MIEPVRDVLIVKTSSMGDVVHALPAVTDLVAAWPGVRVDWLVERAFAGIPARHPGVRRVIPMAWRKWRKSLGDPATRAAMRQCRAALTQHRYDVILDLQGLLKSAVFACLAQGTRSGYAWRSAREPLASLFYQHRFTVPVDLHAVARCRDLAAHSLGYALPASAPVFGLRSQPGAWAPPVEGGGGFAVVVPCASRAEKLWPEARWVEVVRQLRQRGLAVAVFWGNDDELARAQRIATAGGAHVPPFLTVEQVIDVLSGAAVVVGLDTGMTHIAAACGCPTVGLYCDHEPGLAGVTGPGPVISLGGVGQVPALPDVLAALARCFV